MPIPGIFASSFHSSLPAFQGDYWAFNSTTLASAASSVTFTGIPQNYTHLQIRAIGRSTNASAADQVLLQMNGDTSSADYAFHQIYGNGTSAAADGYGTGTLGGVSPAIRLTGASATSGIFGVTVIDILDYTNTNKYKTVRTLNGYDSNGSGEVHFVSGLWLSTSAITSLNFIIQAGGNFAQYTSFALYGVK